MRRIVLAASFALTGGLTQSAMAEDPTVAVAPAPVDLARLAAATKTVDYVFPTGTYARLMNGSMDAMMKSMMGSVGDIPMRDLIGSSGLNKDQIARMGPGTLNQMMDIIDPHYRERTDLMMHTMMDEMGKMMTQFEPGLRGGLSEAYARRYSVDQLDEMNAFFATPTGSAYARDSMLLFMSPEVIGKMQALMPEMIKQMPAIMQHVETVTASLPKARTYDDLTPVERAKLAALLGVPESELKGKKKR